MDWTRGPTLGRGSTATVSIATSPSAGVLAVKSAKLSQSGLLQREQQILSSVSSPHIVTYKGYSVSIENNELYYNLIMEYIPGGTLSDAIRISGGRLDGATIGVFSHQILLGLEYLHSVGLAHCDIKGRNILIGPSGAKIADLGCAREGSPVAGAVSGTPLFMAPEVARGEEQGFPCDIWSLGCTVIEMATGKSPWRDHDHEEALAVMYRIGYSGESLPEFPGVLSEEGKDFLGKCLRRDPKERWTASQLLEHPFIKKHANKPNPIPISSSSPTSILDQGIWNCVEDCQSQIQTVGSTMYDMSGSAANRMRQLSFSSRTTAAGWVTDPEHNWVMIRDSELELQVPI